MFQIKNKGKIFEEDWKKSVPDYCLAIRLPDPPQAFTQRSDTKFSHKNPCDFIIFDGWRRMLFPMELKSTKAKSFTVQLTEDDSDTKMVKYHQINGLTKMSKYECVQPVFVFNFRNEKTGEQTTYIQKIQDFNRMMSEVEKASFNENDLNLYEAIEVMGDKKRTRYAWDIDGILDYVE